MARVHINIGSNLGDRLNNIRRAIEAIRRLWPGVSISSPVESEPWGFRSTNRFINIGASFDTDMQPSSILAQLQSIERQICDSPHRTESGGYTDRAIDIDIIFYGNIVTKSRSLTLPHPRLSQRPFVLIPLSQLEPHWKHPVTNLSARQMLSALNSAP